MYKVFDYEFNIDPYVNKRNKELLRQGDWGEEWVRQYFKSCGLKCYYPPDGFTYYDLELDLNNGKTSKLQIKTLTRFVTKGYYSINDGVNNQALSSIKKCDTLIIVTRSPNHFSIKSDPQYEGKVFIVKNHKNIRIINNEYFIPSDEEHLIHLGTLTKSELDQVNSFQTQKSR